jgi:PAS domain S-box-containing protein
MDFKDPELDTRGSDAAPRPRADRDGARADVLHEYTVAADDSDPVLESIARIASRMFDAPIGVVALVDRTTVRFVARHGMEIAEGQRDNCPFDLVVRTGTELVIEDAVVDPRFADSDFVRSEVRPRFLVAVPLVAPEGAVIGALGVMDTWPRRATSAQLDQLRNLGVVAMQQLVANRQQRGLKRAENELQIHSRHFHNSVDLNCIADLDGRLLEINRRWSEVLGWDIESLRGRSYGEFVHPDDLERSKAGMERLLRGQEIAGLRTRYRRADGDYVWLEWTAHAPAPGESRIFAVARDVGATVANEEALRLQNDMLSLIGESQTRLFSGEKGREWWRFVLDRLLALTGSEYGFIGFTGQDEEGPFLQTKAITNIAWDDATREFYRQHETTGLVFRNMNTLFGRAITSQHRLISNDVATDFRATGRPHGHPPLRTFAGLPIRDGANMVGLVGLANRIGGYDDAMIETIEPVLAYLGGALASIVLEEEHARFTRELAAAKELQDRVLGSLDSGFVALRADGKVTFANPAALTLLSRLDRLTQPEPRGLLVALGKLFPLEPGTRNLELLVAAEEGQPSPPVQLLAKDVDGVAFRVEVVASRVKSGDGSPGDLLLSVRDQRSAWRPRRRTARSSASRPSWRRRPVFSSTTRASRSASISCSRARTCARASRSWGGT